MSRGRILLAVLVALSAPQAWAQQAAKTAASAASPQAQAEADPAAEAFNARDKDHDGKLSLAEFRAGWQQAQRVAGLQARLRHQFDAVDADRNGAIDPAEYGSLLLVKQTGKNAPRMSTFDADRDGKLGFAEYVNLVEALAPRREARKDPGK